MPPPGPGAALADGRNGALPRPDPLARGGPFRAGDRVQLTDPKGRRYTLTLRKAGSITPTAAGWPTTT